MFPVIRSRSGSSHILAAVETLSPPLTAPELGTALLALWDRWERTPCWEELPPELTEVHETRQRYAASRSPSGREPPGLIGLSFGRTG